MLKKLFLMTALSTTLLQSGHTTDLVSRGEQARCLEHPSETPELYLNEFSGYYDLQQLKQKFDKVYSSGKRLRYHAQYDPKTKGYYLFLKQGKLVVPIPLTANFIRNVTRQIEIAIERGYSEHVIYSDMGHTHLFFPKDHWSSNYTIAKTKNLSKQDFITKLLADDKMRPLYHLTEQLAIPENDKHPLAKSILAYKYWNRNYLGSNDGSDFYEILVSDDSTRFNTVAKIAGHFKYSAGFSLSASKDGCFPYKDKHGVTRYFDISLYLPAQDPSTPVEP